MSNLEPTKQEPDTICFFKTDNDLYKKSKRTKKLQAILLLVTTASIMQISSLYWAQSSLHSFQTERQSNFYNLTENQNAGLNSFQKNMMNQDFKAAQYDMHNILTSYEQVGSILGTSYINSIVKTGKFEIYDIESKKQYSIVLPKETLDEFTELGIKYGKNGFNSYQQTIKNYQPCFSYDFICQHAYDESIIHVQKHIDKTAQKLDDNILSILLNSQSNNLRNNVLNVK